MSLSVASICMKRDLWIGAVLVLLAVAMPVAARSGVSGVFWAFTMALVMGWWASRAARVRESRAVRQSAEAVDDGFY